MVDARSRLRIGAFLGLLLLLFVHQRAQLLPRVPLAGEESRVELAPLTLRGWWSGTFQSTYERWLPRRLRLRGWLVRLDNQIGMTLFRQAPSSGTPIVLGRDGMLFEKAYVDEYNRPRRITPQGVRKVVGSLERLDALLRRRGSRLVVVIAPGKPEIYPELLPPRHVVPGREGRRSRYQTLAPALRRTDLALVDAVAILRRERERGDTPVFANGGTHWNHYANGVLASRLLAELDREQPGRYVQVRVTGARTDRAVWSTDDDLGSLLNLFWPRPWPGPQTHPELERVTEGRRLPRLLLTGDSFSLQFLTFMTEERLMEPGESLYYFNRRIRPGNAGEPFDGKAFDAPREVAGMDAVVLVTSDQNVDELGFGFVEAAIRSLERDETAGN